MSVADRLRFSIQLVETQRGFYERAMYRAVEDQDRAAADKAQNRLAEVELELDDLRHELLEVEEAAFVAALIAQENTDA
jgi:hypothetical protein